MSRFGCHITIACLVLAAGWSTGPARVAAGAWTAVALAGARQAPLLRVRAVPGSISVGRAVTLRLSVTDTRGHPVDRAVVSISGLSRPAIGATHAGALTLVVYAERPGRARVVASHAGYAPAQLSLPIVPGSPATILAYKNGVGVLPPRYKIKRGAVGMDLFAAYQALTAHAQLATLGLRDGTLVYMNQNTQVQIFDPLHQRLSAGEIFMEVVHGSASHQIAVGSAVAGTQGTQLDVRLNPTTKVAQVIVAQGRVRVHGRRGTVYVAAGQQTTIAPSGRPTPPRAVNVAVALAWLRHTPRGGGSVATPVLAVPPIPAPVPASSVTGSVNTMTTWSHGPYLVQGNLEVSTGVTLTIEPGTIVEMGLGASMTVEGVLIARGTPVAPIIFTSSQAQPRPGVWGGLVFSGAEAGASVLDHIQVFYAGTAKSFGNPGSSIITQFGASVTIRNSVVADAGGAGIFVDGETHSTIANCIFAANAGVPASLPVGDVGLFTGNNFDAGAPGVLVRAGEGGAIPARVTWTAAVPFLIQGTLNVGGGATLTLAPGTVFNMEPGASIAVGEVGGVLMARGTASAPIIFTSSQAHPRPGDWQGITFEGGGSSASVLDHTQVFYAGTTRSFGNPGSGIQTIFGASITLSNSVIAEASGSGVFADSETHPAIAGCVFVGDHGPAISLPAPDPARVHDNAFGLDQPGVQIRA